MLKVKIGPCANQCEILLNEKDLLQEMAVRSIKVIADPDHRTIVILEAYADDVEVNADDDLLQVERVKKVA